MNCNGQKMETLYIKNGIKSFTSTFFSYNFKLRVYKKRNITHHSLKIQNEKFQQKQLYHQLTTGSKIIYILFLKFVSFLIPFRKNKSVNSLIPTGIITSFLEKNYLLSKGRNTVFQPHLKTYNNFKNKNHPIYLSTSLEYKIPIKYIF